MSAWSQYLAAHPAPAVAQPPAKRVEFGRPGGKPRKLETPAPAPAAFAPAMRPPVWSRHMSAEDSAHYWAIMREAYELGPAAPF